jgi:prevent-host-death family protein
MTAGIRDLKAHLSSYMDKVREGTPVVVTDHGQEVALIVPISRERKALSQLIDKGAAHWSGGKPSGLTGITIAGRPLSETVLEERQ